jgi:hypothetical protein
VKALIPGKNPMKKLTCFATNAHNTPAAPASAPPTTNVVTITLSTLMPMSAAISLSSPTALIDRPVLDLVMSR